MTSLSALSTAASLLAPPSTLAAQPASVFGDAAARPGAPGVSVQLSAARTLALSTISGALLDMKPEPTGAAKEALEFIDSDDFAISDPAAKLALADAIRYGADAFNRRFAVEQVLDNKATYKQLLMRTITHTVVKNRELFPPGEFVMGGRFEDGSFGFVSIAAIGAKETEQSRLTAALDAAKAKKNAALAESKATGAPYVEPPELAGAQAAFDTWQEGLLVAFKFKPAA